MFPHIVVTFRRSCRLLGAHRRLTGIHTQPRLHGALPLPCPSYAANGARLAGCWIVKAPIIVWCPILGHKSTLAVRQPPGSSPSPLCLPKDMSPSFTQSFCHLQVKTDRLTGSVTGVPSHIPRSSKKRSRPTAIARSPICLLAFRKAALMRFWDLYSDGVCVRAKKRSVGAMLPTVSLPSCRSPCPERRPNQADILVLFCPQAASPLTSLDGGRLSIASTAHGCIQALSPRNWLFAEREDEPSRQTIPSTGSRTATHVRTAIRNGCEQAQEELHCLPRMQIGKAEGKSSSDEECRPCG